MKQLLIGARDHALITGQMSTTTMSCLERDNWQCHICGIRLRGFMEVDHINGHNICKLDDVKTICQFCHNLQHALWAANRGRFRIIWAPALKQEILTIISWQVMVFTPANNGRTIDDDLVILAKDVVEDARRRERILGNILGSSNAAGLFETLYSLKRLKGDVAYQSAIDRLNKYVRFWPTATDRIIDKSPASEADFGHWRSDGFTSMSEQLIDTHWREASVENLRNLLASHEHMKL